MVTFTITAGRAARGSEMELKLVLLAAAVGMTLAATGCAAGTHSGASEQSRGQAQAAAARAASARAAAMSDLPFGGDCAGLPDQGQGSIQSMAGYPVETATSHDPQLTMFARVIRAAGLARKLNSATELTVFAPDNGAFAQFGTGNFQTLLGSKTDLRHLVDYQIVDGRVTPARLAAGEPLTSLLGTPVYPAGSAGEYHVDNARVICGDLRTANATVYIVNQLMIP